jgi:hypothetical protein
MKIAICLSGHTRNYKKNYPNYNFNPDVFISTPWQSGLPESTGLDYISYHSQEYTETTKIDLADIVHKYNPKLYTISDDTSVINDLQPFNSYVTKHGAKLNQIGHMFYRMYECNNLRKTYESYQNLHYDYIIRSRFDVKINNINFDPTKVFLWKQNDSVCDLFFAGNPTHVNRISDIYSWFIHQPPSFLASFNNAEGILKHYIDLLDIENMIDNQFDISFTKDSPIQTTHIKYGEKITVYGE